MSLVFRPPSGIARGGSHLPRTHLIDERELVITVSRFCKARSAFRFTAARLADWPDLKASFSAL